MWPSNRTAAYPRNEVSTKPFFCLSKFYFRLQTPRSADPGKDPQRAQDVIPLRILAWRGQPCSSMSKSSQVDSYYAFLGAAH